MWARVAEFMLACWLAMSPFIFRHSAEHWPLWASDFVCAMAVAALSLLSYWQPTRWAHRLTNKKGYPPRHALGGVTTLAADFNSDGRPDILGANHSGSYQAVELWLNGAAPLPKKGVPHPSRPADRCGKGTPRGCRG